MMGQKKHGRPWCTKLMISLSVPRLLYTRPSGHDLPDRLTSIYVDVTSAHTPSVEVIFHRWKCCFAVNKVRALPDISVRQNSSKDNAHNCFTLYNNQKKPGSYQDHKQIKSIIQQRLVQ